MLRSASRYVRERETLRIILVNEYVDEMVDVYDCQC